MAGTPIRTRYRPAAASSPIDTGFIVHNDRTYPNLVKLFRKLGVERQKSDMSFGVSCQKTGFEYSSRGLGGLFAQKSNWLRLRHYRFLREILRFNREAPKVLDDPAGATMTLGRVDQVERFQRRTSAGTTCTPWRLPFGQLRWRRSRSFRR